MSPRQPQQDHATIPRREAIAGLAALSVLAAALVGSVAYRMADPRTGANHLTAPAPEATVQLPQPPEDHFNSPELVDSALPRKAKPIPQVSDAELFQQDDRTKQATHEAPLPQPGR